MKCWRCEFAWPCRSIALFSEDGAGYDDLGYPRKYPYSDDLYRAPPQLLSLSLHRNVKRQNGPILAPWKDMTESQFPMVSYTQSFADSQSFHGGDSLLTKSWYEDPTLDESMAPKNDKGMKLQFKVLCQEVFEKIEIIYRTKNTYDNDSYSKKERVMGNFYLKWRQNVGDNILPALQLMLPHKTQARHYNIKEFTLQKYILEIMQVPKGSDASNDVLLWKKRGHPRGTRLSSILIDLIRKRRQDNPGGVYTVDQVNEILDDMAENQSKASQIKVLREVMENMSFKELGYFFDNLLKDRIIPGMDDLILRKWHPDAVKYYDVVSSLKTVAYRLYNESIKLTDRELSVTVGKAFSPQLAKRSTSYEKTLRELNGEFFIEEKMDGERIQIHWMNYGEEIHYWTRNNTDYTYLYGQTKDHLTISKYLNFNPSVKNCVLDGEMVSYDPVLKTIMQFGTLKGAALNALEAANRSPDEYHPMFIAFDLLNLNDFSLTDRPLKTRKRYLDEILTPVEHHVEIIKAEIATTKEEIITAMDLCIERGSEGVVLKDINSRYLLDNRAETWIKVKPEYLEYFGETLDLVVIGKERSKKNIYFCGLRISNNDTEDTKHPLFWSFCRIANGFTLDLYAEIETLTAGKWHNMTSEAPPSELIVFGKNIPDEWIDPRESFVIQVKARAVDRKTSINYQVGTTLYNAYCLGMRKDKDWTNAATLEEYKEVKSSKQNQSKQNTAFLRKIKRIKNMRKREQEDEVVWNNPSDIGTKSTIFDGLTFKILDDCYYQNKKMRKEEIETIVKNHGGKITFNQDTLSDVTSLRVIGEKATNECNALIGKGYDVLRPIWVFDCIESKSIIKVSTAHLHTASVVLKETAQKRSDKLCGYGFETLFTVDMLSKIFEQNMNVTEVHNTEVDPVLEYIELFGGLRVFLVYDGRPDGYDYLLAKTRLQGFGAKIVETLGECNLVVVCTINAKMLQEVKKIRRELISLARRAENDGKSARVVTVEWVLKSIEEGAQVEQQMYNVSIPRE